METEKAIEYKVEFIKFPPNHIIRKDVIIDVRKYTRYGTPSSFTTTYGIELNTKDEIYDTNQYECDNDTDHPARKWQEKIFKDIERQLCMINDANEEVE